MGSKQYNVVILGDSMVRHICGPGSTANSLFRLGNFNIELQGLSGARISDWADWGHDKFMNTFGWIQHFNPEIIVVAIGTNDLCDSTSLAADVHADLLFFMARVRCHISTPRRVVVLPVLKRFALGGLRSGRYVRYLQTDLDTFSKKVEEVNILNKEFTKRTAAYMYWEYESLRLHLPSAYCSDGVHLNEIGCRRLTRGVKHCVMCIDREWSL